jgi:hypothetical protein
MSGSRSKDPVEDNRRLLEWRNPCVARLAVPAPEMPVHLPKQVCGGPIYGDIAFAERGQ